jgi:uncharacterized protein (TIGR02996 family)
MPDEGSFLQAILTNPTDDLPRLVYADWLDEQQTDEASRKAEFIRLECQLSRSTPPKKQRKRVGQRLQVLAAELDTSWLAVVSKVELENCGVQFEFECPKRWEQLTPLEVIDRRFCTACQREVVYCDTIMDARLHAWAGECVAVDLGVIRRDDDLNQEVLNPPISLGWAPYPRRVKELREPDDTSAARAAKKRAAEQ